MSFFSYSQSIAHSAITSKSPNISYIELPSIPEVYDINVSDKEDGFQFAYPFSVSISKNDIACDTLRDTLYYHVEIVSKGAYSLNLIFENIQVPENAYLAISGKDSADLTYYDYNLLNQTGILPTSIINGERVYVNYVEPVDSKLKGEWTITQVAHDFVGIYQKENELKATAASCNVDVNCEEGKDWQQEKRAVCKLVIQGTTFCTGTLINNTAKDNTPYIITARHCVSNEKKALRTVFYFGYEKESCGEEHILSEKSISGSSLVSTSPDGKLDFALLKMNQIPPKSFEPYYAGWNRQDASVGKGTTCIHHPKGDVKKISIDKEKPSTATFKTSVMTYAQNGSWKISRWNVGTTEGGSSGSSLFDSNHLIIGTLEGGEASCANPENDFFSKFSLAWDYYDTDSTKLEPWLDPLHLGVTKCSGFDPYVLSSNVITNIGINDSLRLYDFGVKAKGLWTGNNDIGWNAVAERFTAAKSIYDVSICGKINKECNLNDVRFCIWKGREAPSEEIYSISMEDVSLKDSAWIYFSLKEPIFVDGYFWVGYTMKNNSSPFASYVAPTDLEGQMYVKHRKGWTSTDSLGFPAHLGVLLHATTRPDTLKNYFYEKPFFANSLGNDTVSMITKEIFGKDSLGLISSNTVFYKISSEEISNWSGTNEIEMDCFANKMIIETPMYLCGVKLAVAEKPIEERWFNLVVWNEDFTKEYYRKTMSSNIVKSGYFNMFYLDSLIYVDKPFAYGICYDPNGDYQKNISLLQYFDVASNEDGFFSVKGNWCPYKNYNVPYNVGLQPMNALTRFHYNPDSAVVIQYPVLRIEEQNLSEKVKCFVYPSVCSEDLFVQFLNDVALEAKVTIYDMWGKRYLSDIYQMNNGRIVISVGDLPSGNFCVQINVGQDVFRQKIIHLKQ
ncbi:MAG: trypsin-like serine protease [Bacteroidales bacterium]|nr:trypsin-like serine protease [Bacteroidales bacterium]